MGYSLTTPPEGTPDLGRFCIVCLAAAAEKAAEKYRTQHDLPEGHPLAIGYKGELEEILVIDAKGKLPISKFTYAECGLTACT